MLVLCELEVGIHQTRRRDYNRRLLAALLRQIRIWPLNPAIALFYADICHELGARGRVLSQVDMILVALTRSMNATILTSDRDFEALLELRVENWLN